MTDRAHLSLLLCLVALGAALAAAPSAQDPPAGRGWSIPLVAPPAPHPSLALAEVPLDGIGCAECHAEIAREWAATQHAHAWVDPLYQDALKTRRRPQSCHGCHVPEPLLQAESFGQKPLPRAEDDAEPRAHGIGCVACHAGPGGAMHGPFGAETDAHASARDERFVGAGSNELCAACHRTTVGPVIGVAKDFETARLAERGMSCVACHMKALERPIAAVEGEEHAARAGRSHALQTPRDPSFLASAFALSARVEGDDVVLALENRAGHRVPGLVGRKLVLAVSALDPDGAELARTEHVIDDVAHVPVLGRADVRLAAPGAASVRVQGVHHAPGAPEPIPFLDETVPASEEAR